MLEQVTTIEKNENYFMFRLDVKDDVNVNSKTSFKRFIRLLKACRHILWLIDW